MSSFENNLETLIGNELRGCNGESITTAKYIGTRKYLGLYFSAHWCPPCRGFTPKLAEWYTDGLKDKLAVIFLSSDKNDKAFTEYHNEMPWAALPFTKRDMKNVLSKKYKVSGIPSFIILDAETGELITKDGRSQVTNDPTGKNCPWKPKTLTEILSEANLIKCGSSKDGKFEKLGNAAKYLTNKNYGLYFSAHWCPPCRGFTPELAKTYKKIIARNGDNNDFEIVFVSSDRDEKAFDEYAGEMPWVAMDYSQRSLKNELSSLLEIQGIPSLVIVGKDGKLINKNGRSAVTGDKGGVECPWYPKPVASLDDAADFLNDETALIVLCENEDDLEQKKIEKELNLVAKKYIDNAKEKNNDVEFKFVFANDPKNSMGKRLRQYTNLTKELSDPILLLLDIPDDGAYYLPENKISDVNAQTIEKYLDEYKNKKLKRKQMA